MIRFPFDWFGMFASIMLGRATYIVSAVLLDVGDVRSICRRALRKRLRQRVAVLTD
jgi:hypothetical protein